MADGTRQVCLKIVFVTSKYMNRIVNIQYGQFKGIHIKEVSLSGRFRRVVHINHIVAVEMYRLRELSKSEVSLL